MSERAAELGALGGTRTPSLLICRYLSDVQCCPEHPPGTARPGQRAETRETLTLPGPPGSKNRHPATRHDVGKTVKRDEPKKKANSQKGLNNKLSLGHRFGWLCYLRYR